MPAPAPAPPVKMVIEQEYGRKNPAYMDVVAVPIFDNNCNNNAMEAIWGNVCAAL